MPIGHSPCIGHTELGCIAFPRIIRLQMISSRDVYKIVGDAKLHRQTGVCSSFMESIPTDLLEHSSDATGAAEVVADVCIWHTGVAPSPACICLLPRVGPRQR